MFLSRHDSLPAAMEMLSNQSYRPVAEDLPDTSYAFTADIFDDHATLSPVLSHSVAYHRAGHRLQDTTGIKTPKAGASKPASHRHVAFAGHPKEQRQSSIHPAYRQRPASGRAGDVTAIDHLIARNGGVTSTFAELPHQLRIAKKDPPMTLTKQVEKLTRQNGNLLEELAFFKDTRNAETKFLRKVHELHRQLKDALEERSREQASAELKFTAYWGIDPDDDNVEDKGF